MLESRPRLSGQRLKSFEFLNKNESRVLVIGDQHEPFCLDGYLDFCIETYNKFNCNKVVMIGDLADNHHASYHEVSSDAKGGSDELDLAISKIQKWYKAFPDADVLLGNHDLLIMRKAQTSNIPTKWIKSYQEVLGVPNWRFTEEVIIDNVMYIHGIGSKAHIRARKNFMSTVQGHHHTECYVQHFVGKRDRFFAMQVGCGVDDKSYAMAYGKWYPKSAIACGVIIGGETAINVLMDL